MNIQIPILILLNDNSENIEITLKSLTNSDILNGFIIIINNHIDVDLSNYDFTVIKPPKKLSENNLNLFAIRTAFTLFPFITKCVISSNNVIFRPGWFIEILKNSLIENISIITFEINNYPYLISKKFYNEIKKLGYFSYSDLSGNDAPSLLLDNISKQINMNSIIIKDKCSSNKHEFISHL